MTLSVQVNGTATAVAEGTSVADLLESRGLARDQRGVAVAIEGEVVRRALWAEVRLAAGQRIEIVTASQGG